METLTNSAGLSIATAVWLAHDTYDNGASQHLDHDVMSATSLLKPTRQIVLMGRIEEQDIKQLDVLDLYPSRKGHAFHDAIEDAWKDPSHAMARLGYPQRVIDRVRINPDPDTVTEDDFPVYLEQRHAREIKIGDSSLMITGKFDQLIDGELNDTKVTSVYTYKHRTKEEDYRIQGSIYRWLRPDLYTSDILRIQHIFSDWKRGEAARDPTYPPNPVHEFTVELMSLRETEVWIRRKVNSILANQNLEDPDLIRCTDEELWKSDPVYKFYSDPQKAASGGRSSKNFSSYPEALAHQQKTGKGTVVSVPGKVKACLYCPARPICAQSQEYDLDD